MISRIELDNLKAHSRAKALERIQKEYAKTFSNIESILKEAAFYPAKTRSVSFKLESCPPEAFKDIVMVLESKGFECRLFHGNSLRIEL